jgi:hypothetical protein
MSTARSVSVMKLGWQVWAVLVSVLALVLLGGVFALTW